MNVMRTFVFLFSFLLSFSTAFSQIKTQKYDVIVIGAGSAGIAAAKELHDSGYHVLVLEAKDRIGGRIWTTMDWAFPLEHGANWIHSSMDNPLFKIAKKNNLAMVPTSGEATSTTFNYFESFTLYDSNGKKIEKNEVEKVRKEIVPRFLAFIVLSKNKTDLSIKALLEEFSKENNTITKKQLHILQYMVTLLSEFHLGADPGQISIPGVLTKLSEIVTTGKELVFREGYIQVLAQMMANVSVLFNQAVKKIRTSEEGVEIETGSHRFFAKTAVITLPLGVLKEGSVEFIPSLPKEKVEAINRLGMGNVNKIFLLFQKPFWDTEIQRFGILPLENEEIAFEVVNFYKNFQRPILLLITSGSFGRKMEEWGDEHTLDYVMRDLKKMFGDSIPAPTGYVITRWSHDPFTRGAYSFPKIGSSAQDYEELAKPIKNRLFFAGEATSSHHSSSVHGAYQSGLDAAEKIKARN